MMGASMTISDRRWAVKMLFIRNATIETPEQALWMSVLCNAVSDLMCGKKNGPYGHLYTEAIRNMALCFLDFTPKLISLDVCVTSRTVMSILLKPSNLLLDLGVAVRTGDFNRLVVEQAHGFSFVENELVELPILPTSEKPTN